MSATVRPGGSDRSAKRGIVLVSVLWTIVLLSALAMAASVSFRSFAGVITIDRDRVQMGGLLSAGLEAGADLLIKSRGESFPIDTELSLPGGIVQIKLSDERGRIDINTAPAAVLAALLNAVDVPNADRLARAVVAWRNHHHRETPANGMEAASALIATSATARPARAGRPRQGEQGSDLVFDDLHQLLQIPDMEIDYLDRLASLTTVFGGDAVNPVTASREVLRVLPQMTPARVEQVMQLRRFPPVDPDRIQQSLGASAAFTKVTGHPAVRIELTAALADGYAAAATAIIVVVSKDTQPYRVLAWTPHPVFAGR